MAPGTTGTRPATSMSTGSPSSERVRHETVVGRVEHRRVQEAVDHHGARGLVHLVFHGHAAERHLDDDVDVIGRVLTDGDGIDTHGGDLAARGRSARCTHRLGGGQVWGTDRRRCFPGLCSGSRERRCGSFKDDQAHPFCSAPQRGPYRLCMAPAMASDSMGQSAIDAEVLAGDVGGTLGEREKRRSRTAISSVPCRSAPWECARERSSIFRAGCR